VRGLRTGTAELSAFVLDLGRGSGGALLKSADAEGGLGAVSYLELREDVRDVVLHCLDADSEGARDFGVAAPVGEQGEYFAFSFGQVGRSLRCRLWGSRTLIV
jgi:hypothetical protein